jgi:type I restriction enzyme S subunit
VTHLPEDVSGWREMRLGDLSPRIVDGSHNPPSKQTTGMPMISARNVENGRIVMGEHRLISSERFAEEDARTQIRPGDVLLTIVGTIGRSAVVPQGIGPIAAQRSVAVIKPTSTVMLPKFLAYQFQGPRARGFFEAEARGTAQKGIYLKTLSSMPIRVAPLAEQRRIVAEIEKQFTRLDAGVAALERLQAHLRRYGAAVLKAACEGRLVPTEAAAARASGSTYEDATVLIRRAREQRRRYWFGVLGKTKCPEPAPLAGGELPAIPEGWSWATFEQMSARVTVGHVGPMKDEYVESGVPFLRSQNIRENRFDPEGLLHVSPAFHAKLAKSVLHAGDIGIVRSGAVGTACAIPESLPEANCADLVIIQRPFGLVPEFGAYYMNSLARARVRAGTVGIALTHFNTKSVAALPVPIPPLREQHRIVAEVERRLTITNAVDASIEVGLARAARLRAAILRAAFEGRLVAPEQPARAPAA